MQTTKTFTLERLKSAQVFRIAPDDTNYIVVLFDPRNASTANIYVIEIFENGGATPPNSHGAAHEFFYVLHGEGEATSDGATKPVRAGDALLLEPGSVHVVRNTGPGRLYTLTVMTPNAARRGHHLQHRRHADALVGRQTAVEPAPRSHAAA